LVGIRGATCPAEDRAEEVLEATRQLLAEVIEANALEPADIVSIYFTATPDIHSAYPATAARQLGLTSVALLGAQEIDVAGGLPRVIRLLVHAYSDVPARHVFQREARTLRPDLADAEG
jgi:chorismate mutase